MAIFLVPPAGLPSLPTASPFFLLRVLLPVPAELRLAELAVTPLVQHHFSELVLVLFLSTSLLRKTAPAAG